VSPPHKSLLLVAIVAVTGTALAVGAYLLLADGSEDTTPLVPTLAPAPAVPPPRETDELRLPEIDIGADVVSTTETTVVYPVELELELVAPAHLPSLEGVRKLGSGGTARIKGQIADASGAGVPATVTFTAGPNAGRVMQCDAEGRFGASDLYPGLAVVTVDGPGIRGSVREVRLRQETEYLLNIGYGRPGTVSGRVFDEKGEPLAGAEVMLDGQRTTSDLEGNYFLSSVTSGIDLFFVVERAGFARISQRAAVTSGQAQTEQNFRMQRAASLELFVAEAIGGDGLAKVILLPEEFVHERSYPWHLVNPIEVRPGRGVVVENLPAQRLTVRLFHEGAEAEPPVQIVTLREGARESVVLHLAAAPTLTGRVVDPEGRPVPDARVRLEAPDRVGATLTLVGSMPAFLETEVMPTFPVALQEAVATTDGRFLFSAYAKYAPKRYLVAESPDGALWGARIVAADAGDVTLQLEPVRFEKSLLEIEFPGRYQGLPVRLAIQGEPRGKTTIGPDEPLTVPDLPHGTWRLRARWQGQTLTGAAYDQFELAGPMSRSIAVPPGAIHGQDAETRDRVTGRR
jgi:hypothetical protein